MYTHVHALHFLDVSWSVSQVYTFLDKMSFYTEAYKHKPNDVISREDGTLWRRQTHKLLYPLGQCWAQEAIHNVSVSEWKHKDMFLCIIFMFRCRADQPADASGMFRTGVWSKTAVSGWTGRPCALGIFLQLMDSLHMWDWDAAACCLYCRYTLKSYIYLTMLFCWKYWPVFTCFWRLSGVNRCAGTLWESKAHLGSGS